MWPGWCGRPAALGLIVCVVVGIVCNTGEAMPLNMDGMAASLDFRQQSVGSLKKSRDHSFTQEKQILAKMKDESEKIYRSAMKKEKEMVSRGNDQGPTQTTPSAASDTPNTKQTTVTQESIATEEAKLKAMKRAYKHDHEPKQQSKRHKAAEGVSSKKLKHAEAQEPVKAASGRSTRADSQQQAPKRSAQAKASSNKPKHAEAQEPVKKTEVSSSKPKPAEAQKQEKVKKRSTDSAANQAPSSTTEKSSKNSANPYSVTPEQEGALKDNTKLPSPYSSSPGRAEEELKSSKGTVDPKSSKDSVNLHSVTPQQEGTVKTKLPKPYSSSPARGKKGLTSSIDSVNPYSVTPQQEGAAKTKLPSPYAKLPGGGEEELGDSNEEHSKPKMSAAKEEQLAKYALHEMHEKKAARRKKELFRRTKKADAAIQAAVKLQPDHGKAAPQATAGAPKSSPAPNAKAALKDAPKAAAELKGTSKATDAPKAAKKHPKKVNWWAENWHPSKGLTNKEAEQVKEKIVRSFKGKPAGELVQALGQFSQKVKAMRKENVKEWEKHEEDHKAHLVEQHAAKVLKEQKRKETAKRLMDQPADIISTIEGKKEQLKAKQMKTKPHAQPKPAANTLAPIQAERPPAADIAKALATYGPGGTTCKDCS